MLLNPATGDTERRRRPTLERCISLPRASGHTGLVIVNLFAFRDTNPRNLRTARDAVGPPMTKSSRSSRLLARRPSRRGVGTANYKDDPVRSDHFWIHPCAWVLRSGENRDTRYMWQRILNSLLGFQVSQVAMRKMSG